MKQRVAHITDIHWMTPPPIRRLPGKRLVGSANLYLMDRKSHFCENVQAELMSHVQNLSPDCLLISGDLTAQALPAEFEKAKQSLQPILNNTPTFLINGNHDVYTVGSKREKRTENYFREHMHINGPIQIWDCESRLVLGLDASRPHPFLASGVVPRVQLDALLNALNDDIDAAKPVILVLHYPILDREGALYNGSKHGLRNAEELISVLKEGGRKPNLIVHGHVHHGYTVSLELGTTTCPIHDCGSSGYAYLPDLRRAAAMNVYEFDGANLVGLTRYLYDGKQFSPEPGGPYATGR